jgi:hypothetical protein
MTIEATFNSLLGHHRTLREALQNLRLTIVEDRPRGDSVVILERMSDAIDDLNGWLEESHAAVGRGAKAVSYPIDGPRAIAGLSDASARFEQLHDQFFFGLAGYRQMTDLAGLCQSRGREWRAWSDGVKEAIDQTSLAIREIQRALLSSWQELAERMSASSVSVQTTNIGQQISTANETVEARLSTREQVRDRMT